MNDSVPCCRENKSKGCLKAKTLTVGTSLANVQYHRKAADIPASPVFKFDPDNPESSRGPLLSLRAGGELSSRPFHIA